MSVTTNVLLGFGSALIGMGAGSTLFVHDCNKAIMNDTEFVPFYKDMKGTVKDIKSIASYCKEVIDDGNELQRQLDIKAAENKLKAAAAKAASKTTIDEESIVEETKVDNVEDVDKDGNPISDSKESENK